MKLTLANYNEHFGKGMLSNMLLNATNQCNLRCSYCFTTPNPQRMSIETAKTAILWGLKHKAPWCDNLEMCWFGGEPMLEFDRLLVPIMAWGKERGLPLAWNITTNLTLLNDERLEILKNFDVGILASIDGPASQQDACRKTINGEGSWKIIKDIIPKVAAYPRAYGYRSTISPRNCDNLFESYKHAYESGFGMWFGGPDVCSEEWSEEKILALQREMFYITMSYYDLIGSGEVRFMLPQLEQEIKEILVPYTDLSKGYRDRGIAEFQRCGLGTTSVGVSPDGKLIACQEHSTYLEEDIFFIGDVFNGIDIERHLKILNTYAKDKEEHYTKVWNNQKCLKCAIRDSCSDQGLSCPSTSYQWNKKLVTINDFYCEFSRIMHAMGELFLKRAEMEKRDLSKYLKRILEKEVKF